MKRCIRCVLPESFPKISFDKDGVCSHCNKFSESDRFIPSLERLQAKLEDIVREGKARNSKYDALVAYSGGKDSTFLIHTLKEKYGLSMLAVTFDNGFMSQHSFDNMKTVLNALNVDHLIVRPRQDLMKKAFLESSGTDIYPSHLTSYGSGICITCIRMVGNMSLRIAIEKQIPMVMLGNSPGQLIQSENEIIFQDNKIPYALRRALFKPLADKVGEDIYYYLMLDKEEYKTKPFPYTINAFPLIGYNEDEIYKAIKSLGWRKPEDVDPNSTNCQLNSLGILKHKEGYKFHPYDYEMSMLVRLGIISREEALSRVEDPENKVEWIAKEIEKKLMV